MLYRDKNRKKEPKKASPNAGTSTPSGGPYKSVGFKKPEGATQSGGRSLGFKKVKTSMDEKGL